jgi:hypothetical protein
MEIIGKARAELARAAVQELKRTAKALGLSVEEMLELGEKEE